MAEILTRTGLRSLVDTNLPSGTGGISAEDHRDVEDSLVDSLATIFEAEVRVINMTTTTPPGGASDRDAYVVASGATGAWSGKDDQIAIWDDDKTGGGGWQFSGTPEDGQAIWNLADDTQYRWDTGVSPAAWVAQTGAVASSFAGFRAIQTSAQSVGTSTVMALDSVSGSNDAFNQGVDIGDLLTDDFFTVPAGLDGSFADFTAGMETASDQGIFVLKIQRSVDSGSNWDDIAQDGAGDGYFGIGNVSTGAIKLSSGDLWRVSVQSASTVNTSGDRKCFFEMTVLGS